MKTDRIKIKPCLPGYNVPHLVETLNNFSKKKITQHMIRSYIRRGKINATKKDGKWHVSAEEFVKIVKSLC